MSRSGIESLFPLNPDNLASFMEKYETSLVFSGKYKVFFRPIRPADADLLKSFFLSHSKNTIWHRYLGHISSLSSDQIRKFVTLDQVNDFALIGLHPGIDDGRIVCIGRYCRSSIPDEVEIAITVHDDFQGNGIGTFLVRTLMAIASSHGIKIFTATVLADNLAMMHVFHKVATKMEIRLESDVYEVRFPTA